MVTCHLVVNEKNTEYDDIDIGYGDSQMATDTEWQDRAKSLLKAELKRRNVGYRELAEKLAVLGIHETERNIANKISRGGFTAVFLLQCLEAVGATSLRLSDS